MMLAPMAASRSAYLARSVGAVIVRKKQVLAIGYNGAPSGSAHCIAPGFCYPGLSSCDASKTLPSRAVHAEASAMALRAPQVTVKLLSMESLPLGLAFM
jgi:dCMP deaminase